MWHGPWRGCWRRTFIALRSSASVCVQKGLATSARCSTGHAGVPGAQWVVVDRAWNVIWGHRDFRDLGEASRYIGHGAPTADDLRVVRALLHDPRFEAVYLDAAAVQAVFKRAGAAQSAAPARPPH